MHYAPWTFCILTFGCKVNQYESQSVREAWQRMDGAETDAPAEADVILQAARDQLAAFINPRRRIGVEVPRSAIDAALHVQGVRKVDLIGWADIAPSPTQAAYCTGFTVERAP